MYYSCRFYVWVISEVIKFRDGAFIWREPTELEENVSILLFCLLQEQGEFGALILGCVEYWVHCTWNHLFFTCENIVFTYSFICPFSQQIFNTMCQVLFWVLNITVNKMDSAAAKSLQSCLTLDYNPPWLLCPWDSPGKNTGVGCHALLQGIFLTQGLNLCLFKSPALANGFFTISATEQM